MTKIVVIMTLMLGASNFAIAKGNGPCAKDRETLCAGMEKGEKTMMCMKENEEKLSAECKAHRAEMKEGMKDVKAACEADVESLCGDEKPGHGRIMRCLKRNKAKVSEACKSEMADMKAMRKNGK